MVTKSLTAILCIVLLPSSVHAQEIYNRKGMLSASATFSPGFMTARNEVNYYLQGFLDARIEKRFSIRGDVYYYLGSPGVNDLFKHHHTVAFGALYHIPTQRNIDPYVGIQPGICVSQLNPLPTTPDGAVAAERVGISPVITVMTGFTYYVSPYFHFFGTVRYMAGRHFSNTQGTIPLSEVSISAGLGFNLNVLKLRRRA